MLSKILIYDFLFVLSGICVCLCKFKIYLMDLNVTNNRKMVV